MSTTNANSKWIDLLDLVDRWQPDLHPLRLRLGLILAFAVTLCVAHAMDAKSLLADVGGSFYGLHRKVRLPDSMILERQRDTWIVLWLRDHSLLIAFKQKVVKKVNNDSTIPICRICDSRARCIEEGNIWTSSYLKSMLCLYWQPAPTRQFEVKLIGSFGTRTFNSG